MNHRLPILVLVLLSMAGSLHARHGKLSEYLLLRSMCSQIDTNGNFIRNDSLIDYNYDTITGNFLGRHAQLWDVATSTYKPDSKDTMFYNSNGLPVTHLYQGYTGTQYINVVQELMYYDSAGVDTMVRSQQWNNTKKAWVDLAKERHSYNAAKTRDQVTQLLWNSAKNRWDNTSRISYLYNSTGMETGSIEEVWNGTGWDSSSMTTITYNSTGQPQQILTENVSFGSRTNSGRTIYTYNSNNPVEELTQFWNGTDWQHDTRIKRMFNTNGTISQETVMNYDFTSHQAKYAEQCNYTYSLLTPVQKSQVNSSQLRIYPQPANEEISIITGATASQIRCQVLDLNGRIIHDATYSSPLIRMNTSNWKRGIYLLRILSAEGSVVRKIVKE